MHLSKMRSAITENEVCTHQNRVCATYHNSLIIHRCLCWLPFDSNDPTQTKLALPILHHNCIIAPHSYLCSLFQLFVMKSIVLDVISAIALTSATDVQVTLTDNTDGSLSQTLTLTSGVCREPKFFLLSTNSYAEFHGSDEDGLESGLDKIISKISPAQGIICSLFEEVQFISVTSLQEKTLGYRFISIFV